eukprot:367482-Amphidinium_carterae.2
MTAPSSARLPSQSESTNLQQQRPSSDVRAVTSRAPPAPPPPVQQSQTWNVLATPRAIPTPPGSVINPCGGFRKVPEAPKVGT